jgi:hypothetical protein
VVKERKQEGFLSSHEKAIYKVTIQNFKILLRKMVFVNIWIITIDNKYYKILFHYIKVIAGGLL